MLASRARLLCLLGAATLGAGALAGCGSSDGGGEEATTPAPVSNPESFPTARGKTMGSLVAEVPKGPTLAASVDELEPGPSRFGFGLFDAGRKQVRGAPAALYVSARSGLGLRGPFPVREESLAVKPQFQSQTSSQDPDSARSVYVADVPFSKPGQYVVTALVRLDDRLVASTLALVKVGGGRTVRVGAPAPRISTPTAADVSGDLAQIDTRLPPGTMHDVDAADALGKQPLVLVFATPQLCQSRVCGPIVDEVEQVKDDVGDKAAFVHMEVFQENKLERGYRPQLKRFGLTSEPWIFGIDRSGKVVARLQGAASVAEIRALADTAIGS